jgi:hypothetical protein
MEVQCVFFEAGGEIIGMLPFGRIVFFKYYVLYLKLFLVIQSLHIIKSVTIIGIVNGTDRDWG